MIEPLFVFPCWFWYFPISGNVTRYWYRTENIEYKVCLFNTYIHASSIPSIQTKMLQGGRPPANNLRLKNYDIFFPYATLFKCGTNVSAIQCCFLCCPSLSIGEHNRRDRRFLGAAQLVPSLRRVAFMCTYRLRVIENAQQQRRKRVLHQFFDMYMLYMYVYLYLYLYVCVFQIVGHYNFHNIV